MNERKLWAVDVFEDRVHVYRPGEEHTQCGIDIGRGGMKVQDKVPPQELNKLCKSCGRSYD